MAKNYKTANGQEIDMEQLILKNENVRAVGNMSVNARGDVINNTNKPISDRATQVNKNYRKQTGNVAKNVPVVSKKDAERVALQQAAMDQADEILKELDGLSKTPVVEEVAPVKAKTKSIKTAAKTAKKEPASGGLAAAIAKAETKDK